MVSVAPHVEVGLLELRCCVKQIKRKVGSEASKASAVFTLFWFRRYTSLSSLHDIEYDGIDIECDEGP